MENEFSDELNERGDIVKRVYADGLICDVHYDENGERDGLCDNRGFSSGFYAL